MFGLALFLVSAAAPKAHAGVIVGVSVGAPVYVHPVHPYRYFGPRYGYIAPRAVVAFSPAPVYRRVYVAPAPVYYSHWARAGTLSIATFTATGVKHSCITRRRRTGCSCQAEKR